MDRILLLILVLLGLVSNVWCQTVEITNVEATITQGSDVYIETSDIDELHTITFDLDITLGAGGVGADDAVSDRWSLTVWIVDNGLVDGPYTLTKNAATFPNGPLTQSQAGLTIPAGQTRTMTNVEFSFKPSVLGICPDRCPDDGTDERHKLKVQVTSPIYNIVGAAGVLPADVAVDMDDPLTCRGAVLSLVPHITSGLPIIENTIHTFVVDVIVTSDANGRDVVQPGATPVELWDLKFTLEKNLYDADGNVIDCDIIETVDETGGGITNGDDEQELPSGGSITFNQVSVPFDLADLGITTCHEFDKFCVEILQDAVLATDPTEITFAGSTDINTDITPAPASKNPKKCINIIKPDHCNGVLITDIAIGLVTDQSFCQGTDENVNTQRNQIDLTMTVHLHEDSAPLTVSSLPATGPALTMAAGKDIWQAYAYASSTSDCTDLTVGAVETYFENDVGFDVQFNDLEPGEGNTFPQLTAHFDLTDYGCQQVKYICVQLFRKDSAVLNNAVFTYEFLRGTNEKWISSVIIDPDQDYLNDFNTSPPSSQWAVTEIDCQGVSLQPNDPLLPDENRQNLGEYTNLHRIDFAAHFEADVASDCGPDGTTVCNQCGVQGDNLWRLEAFLTRKSDPNNINNLVDAANPDTWVYPYVSYVNTTLVPGQEDQNVPSTNLDFTDVRADFDLSNLDCQEGPFYLCVWLRKNPDADEDFKLENWDDPTKYVVCSEELDCVGVDLTSTTLSEAATPTDNNFPLRQGVSDVSYLIDVALESDELAGSIRPDPVPDFNRPDPVPDFNAVDPNDLWDFHVYLANSALGADPILSPDPSYTVYDNRNGLFLEGLELQAGDMATFESVRVPIDMSNVQCHEFTHLCVEVRHGASHDQCGLNPGTVMNTDANTLGTTARAPTLEPKAGNPRIQYTENDVVFDDTSCVPPMNSFYDFPTSRPMSDNVDCIPVECRGVEIVYSHCRIDNTPENDIIPLDGDIQEGEVGAFHLQLDYETDPDAGAVVGVDLWQISVFLSPDANGETVTISKDAVPGVWEDTDVVNPGDALSFNVWTDNFELNYPCEEIRYLCVRLEKGTTPSVGVEPDNDFTLSPNPLVTCKLLDSCGGVILEDVGLSLNGDNPDKNLFVVEKQDSDVNQLCVDVDLVFDEQTAEFTHGTDFWDLEFVIARDDAGNDVVATHDITQGNFDDLDGAVVGFEDPDVADRTTSLLLDGDTINPQFDLTDVTCNDGDTADPHLYLCVRVSKGDDPKDGDSIDFTLYPEQYTTCIKIECQGVIFATPNVDLFEVSPDLILEVTDSNIIEIAVEFPIEDNGARIAAGYPSDLWHVVICLTAHADGAGDSITETVVDLDEDEARQPVSSTPLWFNNKDVVLDMYDKRCPPVMYICAKLEENPDAEPDCTIDTTAAIVCKPIECKGVEFTTIDFDLAPETCLVEHESMNLVEFDFTAMTAENTASVSPGSDLWRVTTWASVDPNGEGLNQFGKNETIFETSLTAGGDFVIDDVTVQLNLDDFICPMDTLYLCVLVERNDDAVPNFSVTTNPDPFQLCKEVECKGVRITGMTLLDTTPTSVTERSGDSTITTDLRITTDRDYAGIEGVNLWSITGELRDDAGNVIESVPADLTQAQRNQGLVAGQSTTFDDLELEFDLDRNVPCPDSGHFTFCVIVDKGERTQGLSPDFSIDETSLTETCRDLTCRGICIEASSASVARDSPLQEGVSNHEVWLDASFYSDPDYAGIIEDDAIGLWKVNVFASPDGIRRLAETEGTLATNNANYPLPSGGVLHLSDISAMLDFSNDGDYLTCNDIKFICVELERGDDPNPDFSLFGCPSTRLVACAEFECRGVLLENVVLELKPGQENPRENDQDFPVEFDLRLTPHEDTSILPGGPAPGNAGSNYWGVEIFASSEDASLEDNADREAVTLATIPLEELNNGIDRPAAGPGSSDTTLSGLSAVMDLSDTYCGDLEYLCARVFRGTGADPPFTVDGVDFNGEIEDIALIGCQKVDCDGVAITDADIRVLDPEVVAEGNPNWEFEFDVNFETDPDGGGVFGSNLWRLATFLAFNSDGSRGVYDVNNDNIADVIYPVLTGGAESQTLEPGNDLGFQNVEVSFDTQKFACENDKLYFCVRLEKDEERSSSEFTLSSAVDNRQTCEEIECRGVTITQLDFATDRTIITEREEDQKFELDIIATTDPTGGSVSGTDLWHVDVFFNDQEDGLGNDFSSAIEADLEEDDANRAVSAGGDLVLDDVEVDLSAADVLCGAETMYLCVRLTENSDADPNFSLSPEQVIKCKEVTCNPVIFTNAQCTRNAPQYLLENVLNNVNFEIGLTSHSLSAVIVGDNLWTLPRVYLTDTDDGLGTVKVSSEAEFLSQAQRDRDLTESGNSITLSDVTAYVDLTGQTCEDIKYMCLEFGKNDAADPDFTLDFQGTEEPPWCKPIECKGVEATSIELNIDTLAIKEGTDNMDDILFDVKLNTNAGAAGISGDDLWEINYEFVDSNHNAVDGWPTASVPLGDAGDQDLIAGIPIDFVNLLAEDLDLANAVCPDDGLYFCVSVSKDDDSTVDFTLSEVTTNSLRDCQPIHCEGVLIEDTLIEITAGREISETTPSANHIINFDFEATSDSNSRDVNGNNLWQVNVFGSRNEDGTGPRYLPATLALSVSQRDQDLNGGAVLPFNNLAHSLDLRGVRCVDFRYFCAEIKRDPASFPEFSLQGVDDGGNLDNSHLISCQAMDCVGAYITTFNASPSDPVILLENTDNQLVFIDAFLESDVAQESVTGVNLWAMNAFFNPSPDCQAVDGDGNQIRIEESDVTIFGGEDDQALLAGGSINFNDVQVDFDYQGTCDQLEDAYLCLEVIRSPSANPPFTLLGNTLIAVPAQCRGVEVTDTTIVAASWTPSPFLERAPETRRKRQTEYLTFDLDVLVETNGNAAGVEGSDLWRMLVYLSGDEHCQTWNNDTAVWADLSSAEANQDVTPGAPLTFTLDNVQIPVDNVLCENAQYVCAHLDKGGFPSDEFTLTGVPDESSLVGSWPLDCRGVRIVNSELEITAGLPVITGSPNHQLVFSFTIDTDPNSAGISGTDLFTLYVYGNDQADGFGQIPNNDQAAYLLPITQEVTLTPGTSHSFEYLPARLNLQGVSCDEIPYVCVQIYRGVAPDPNYTLQPDNQFDPVFIDCVQVPCSGVVVEELELEFTAGLPLLEDAPAHRLDFILSPSASQFGGSAVGSDLWAADIFISSNPDGRGDKYALTPVIIVNPDENLNRGGTADLLSNAVLDLSGVVCLNVQYICVDLYKGEEANPDFTLGGTTRVCQGFTCKGVDFINPGISVHDDVVLRMLTPNTHIEFDAYVDTTLSSSTVTGANLFKVTVFASANPDGSGTRYGETYADASAAGEVHVNAGQRSYLNNVNAYLDLTGVYCSELRYICIEIWRGDFANPFYQIDSPSSQSELRVCQQTACYGVQIASVVPSLTLGSPLIENERDRNTWIDIELNPSHYSASIIGDNLWKATCFANSNSDGSGIRYSVKNAILQQSELNKDLQYSTVFYTDNPEPPVLENAVVSMDYSGRHCYEIQYICCTIGENDNASPDFDLQGEYGNNNLLTGCTHVPCLGVGITSTRLALDSLQILKGDESHTFTGDVTVSFWRESRAIQEDNTWYMGVTVLDNDANVVAEAPIDLIQEQQDYGVIPGNDLTFSDLQFEVDLSDLECFQIAYVCVHVGTQLGTSFTLEGVTDSGELSYEALIGCSPHLRCGDFAVDIEVTDVGERHIEVQWNEGEGDFDTYVISYSPEESIVESPQHIPRNLRGPLRFDGLTPGQEYTFSLYLYKGGTVKAGPVTEVERTKPSTVNVVINRQTNSELHVQWTEAEGVYDTYRVELYPQGTPPTPLYVDALAPRELIFSGLREAREYTVTIYTLVGGRSGYRSEPGYASETTQPAPPFLELGNTEPGTTYVDLKWIAPNGYLVAGYKLQSDPDDEGNNLPLELDADLDAYRVTGLVPGREYEFSLQAYAVVEGDKVYSVPSTISARTYPEAVPSAEVDTATTSTITFEWHEPPGDKDSYRISYAEQQGPPQTISALLPRRFTASSLDLAVSYEFTIVTVSGGLESEPFTFFATTNPNRPGPIITTEVDTDQINIEWDHAQGPREGYEVRYSPTHPSYQPQSPFFTTSNEFSLSGLHPHTTIDFEVRTVSNTAFSEPSIWRQRTYPALPGAVQYFTVEPSGASSVLLRFSQPEYSNGVITAYMVAYECRKPGVLGVDSGLQTITALPNEADFETEITNLRSGYTCSFTIRAVNSEGQGDLVRVDGVTLIAGLPIFLENIYNQDFFGGISTTSSTIDNVPIDAALFSDVNGDIIGYTVLVVEDKHLNKTAPVVPYTYNQVSGYEVWPVWQTLHPFTIDYLYERRRRSVFEFGYYTVGDDDKCSQQPRSYYCNGPLEPLTTYRVAVRAHTEAGYAQTPWSHPVTTNADRWWFAYAAIPFLLVVLVLAIILALCACSAAEKKVDRRRKFQNDTYYRDDFTDYAADGYNENVNMNASGSTIFMIPSNGEPPIPGPGTMESKKLNPTHVLGTRPIQINKFQQHVQAMAASNAAKFQEEYENLRPIGDDLARLIGGLPENKEKNRFNNILPYDYNRVQLPEDTYINASFIGGFNSRHEYIATQGPLSSSIEDFWSMVWENNCPTLVMMGRCIEDGHVKSEQYWPESDFPVTYGNLTITMVSEKVGDEWTVRDFTIQSGSEIRAVRQFNFTAWPNHGVPETTEGVVRFVSTVRAEAPQHSGPMVIHCGAGIGRTGIFLALDILMQGLVYDETTVDVYGTVSSLRKQRCCMVQTVHQYIFLHKAMLDILQGKASGYNWLLRPRKGSVGSRDSDQFTSDTL